MSTRQRCLKVGCNPKLKDPAAAQSHREDFPGHRTAAWPVRSAEGRRRAKARNQSGYYDKYNVGAKSAEARGYYNAGGGRVAETVSLDELTDPYDEGWTHG